MVELLILTSFFRLSAFDSTSLHFPTWLIVEMVLRAEDDATDSTSPFDDIGRRENIESCGLYLNLFAFVVFIALVGTFMDCCVRIILVTLMWP